MSGILGIIVLALLVDPVRVGLVVLIGACGLASAIWLFKTLLGEK